METVAVVREQKAGVSVGKWLFTMLGMVLILAGAGALLWLGYGILMVINHPQEVPLVQLLLEQVKSADLSFYGRVDEHAFELNLSPQMRTILFLVVAVMLFSTLAGIVKSLISAGIDLLNLVSRRWPAA